MALRVCVLNLKLAGGGVGGAVEAYYGVGCIGREEG